MTDSFVAPTKENFKSLIIKNGSEISDQIKELIETTRSWLKTETVVDNDRPQMFESEVLKETEIDSLSDPDPIAF